MHGFSSLGRNTQNHKSQAQQLQILNMHDKIDKLWKITH